MNNGAVVTPFQVQITAQCGGAHFREIVFADSLKSALIKVIQSIPEDSPAWQFPGWQVQVFPQRDAFICKHT